MRFKSEEIKEIVEGTKTQIYKKTLCLEERWGKDPLVLAAAIPLKKRALRRKKENRKIFVTDIERNLSPMKL